MTEQLPHPHTVISHSASFFFNTFNTLVCAELVFATYSQNETIIKTSTHNTQGTSCTTLGRPAPVAIRRPPESRDAECHGE